MKRDRNQSHYRPGRGFCLRLLPAERQDTHNYKQCISVMYFIINTATCFSGWDGLALREKTLEATNCSNQFLATWRQWKQTMNITLTVGRVQLPACTFSRYWARWAFIWNLVFVHLMNISPIFTLVCSHYTPENWLALWQLNASTMIIKQDLTLSIWCLVLKRQGSFIIMLQKRRKQKEWKTKRPLRWTTLHIMHSWKILIMATLRVH